MRQLNDTGYDRHVSVWPSEEFPDAHPFVVAAGEEKDYPVLLNGFTVLEEPVPVVEPVPVKAKRKDAAVAAEQEVGEPQ